LLHIAENKLKNVSLLNNDNSNNDKNEIIEEEERTLALISYNDHLYDIINHIKKEGFTVIDTKTIQFSLEQAKEFYSDHQTQNYYDKMVKWLSSG
jgi:hypothetical protein